MFDFTGKVAVVTGGEKGIGRAAAHELAGAGAAVIILGIDEEAGHAAATEAPGEATFLRVDVSSEEQVRELPARVKRTYGLTNVLVNNAGIIVAGTVLDTEFETWRKVMSVNLDGAFLVTKYLIPHMQERGGGVIVNVGSEAGLVGFKGQVAYNVSKAGIIHLTRSLAVAFAERAANDGRTVQRSLDGHLEAFIRHAGQFRRQGDYSLSGLLASAGEIAARRSILPKTRENLRLLVASARGDDNRLASAEGAL